MNNETVNVPDTIRVEARDRALAILNSDQTCISYVRPEDLETAALFIPVVSIIKPKREDFYDPIPNIGIMAKPPLMNQMRELAGVNITRTETSKRGEYIWVAHAWGEKRQPDGTMLPQDCSYEFDAEKRAEMDILKQPDKYKTETQKRLHVLELAKFGEQRAVTGAQHALICKLAKCARSFKTAEELMRGMKLLRIDRNVNGILQDPSMRQAVIEHALGSQENVFGPRQLESKPEPMPQRKIDPDTGEITEPAPVEEGQADLFQDDIPFEESELEKAIRIRAQITDLLNDPAVSNNRDKGLKWLQTEDAKNLKKLVEKQEKIEAAIRNYRERAKGRKAS